MFCFVPGAGVGSQEGTFVYAHIRENALLLPFGFRHAVYIKHFPPLAVPKQICQETTFRPPAIFALIYLAGMRVSSARTNASPGNSLFQPFQCFGHNSPSFHDKNANFRGGDKTNNPRVAQVLTKRYENANLLQWYCLY